MPLDTPTYYRADITLAPSPYGPPTPLDPTKWSAVKHHKALAETHGLTFHRLTIVPDDCYRVLFEAWSEEQPHDRAAVRAEVRLHLENSPALKIRKTVKCDG